MYKKDVHASKYAQKLIQKLVSLRYILQRKLPGNAGAAYVISARGAAWLNANSTTEQNIYKDNTDWGRTVEGVWHPPTSWIHDLYALGVLSWLCKEGDVVIPEMTLRRLDPTAKSLPDGLVIEDGEGSARWLEVEQSRKSGKNLEKTIRNLVAAARGNAVTKYRGIDIDGAMLAIPAHSIDERGNTVNHLKRIENKIAALRVSKTFVIRICLMHIRGFTVERVEFVEDRFFESA